ncbi:MAG: phosphonate metabolism transcriptional regulator PhnF [Pseudomonadota bacterium]
MAKLWEMVAKEIEQSIHRREFTPGDKLPTEAEYSRRFMVNRNTLRRALAHLQERGLIESTQGRGSYVRRPAIRYTIGKRTRFTDAMQSQSLKAATRTLDLTIKTATREICEALDMPPGSKTIELRRLGFAGDEPVSLSVHNFSYKRFPFFVKMYRDNMSVTEALMNCGVLDFTRKRTVVQSRLPDATEAQYLNLPRHVPLIITRAWNVDSIGDAIEYGTAFFASDRVQLNIESDRPTEH